MCKFQEKWSVKLYYYCIILLIVILLNSTNSQGVNFKKNGVQNYTVIYSVNSVIV